MYWKEGEEDKRKDNIKNTNKCFFPAYLEHCNLYQIIVKENIDRTHASKRTEFAGSGKSEENENQQKEQFEIRTMYE